jgi:beta-N-acetylhexosaminidase
VSLRQQLGQLLISSFEGGRLPAYLKRRLRVGETAGVVLFGRNVGSRGGVVALTRSVQRAAGGRALVVVDQEGGAIRTLPFAGPAVGQAAQGAATGASAGREAPSAPGQVGEGAAASGHAPRDSGQVGEGAAASGHAPRDSGQVGEGAHDSAAAAPAGRAAEAAARELRGAGVNVDLAPVADVAVGPGSVMAGRAFAGDAGAVGASTAASVSGLLAARVAPAVKHFPGFGRATANTDDAPVTIDASRAQLEAVDLQPFRRAIDAGAPLVMASHALYPAWDARHIASQSPAILRTLLRERLGFRGAVVTDSLEAEAVLARSSVELAAERSLAAGADLLLMTGQGSWSHVFPYVLRRARHSAPLRARIAESFERVQRLKAKIVRR